VTAFGGSARNRPATGPEQLPVAAPEGWQTISSLGVEISVPPTWAINGRSCAQQPTVYRAQDPSISLRIECRPDADLSEVSIGAYVAPALAKPHEAVPQTDRPSNVTVRPVLMTGRPAAMGQGRMVDGRAFLSLGVPSLDVSVTAVGPDLGLIHQILSTVRPVQVDSRGCSTAAPARPSWDLDANGPRVHVDRALTVDVCYYLTDLRPPGTQTETPRLAASTRLSGLAAQQVSAALNAARSGVSGGALTCGSLRVATIWLGLHDADGRTVQLVVHFPGRCGASYVTSEQGSSQLTGSILKAVMEPLRISYAAPPGMPG
jgi:hypothetical protein